MPYEVQSPLSAALGFASSYLQGQQAQKRYTQEEAQKQQQQAIANALAQAQLESERQRTQIAKQQMGITYREHGLDANGNPIPVPVELTQSSKTVNLPGRGMKNESAPAGPAEPASIQAPLSLDDTVAQMMGRVNYYAQNGMTVLANGTRQDLATVLTLRKQIVDEADAAAKREEDHWIHVQQTSHWKNMDGTARFKAQQEHDDRLRSIAQRAQASASSVAARYYAADKGYQGRVDAAKAGADRTDKVINAENQRNDKTVTASDNRSDANALNQTAMFLKPGQSTVVMTTSGPVKVTKTNDGGVTYSKP